LGVCLDDLGGDEVLRAKQLDEGELIFRLPLLDAGMVAEAKVLQLPQDLNIVIEAAAEIADPVVAAAAEGTGRQRARGIRRRAAATACLRRARSARARTSSTGATRHLSFTVRRTSSSPRCCASIAPANSPRACCTPRYASATASTLSFCTACNSARRARTTWR